MFPTENKRRIQPKAYVAVQSTGLARDLVAAVNMQNGIVRNAVNGEVGTLTGTAATPASTCGLHGKLFASGTYSFTKSNLPASTSPFTILVIQNYKGNAANWQSALAFNSAFCLYLPATSATPRVSVYATGGGLAAISPSGSIATGKSQTVVVTNNLSVYTAYIDGVAQASPATSSSVGSWTAPVTLKIGGGEGNADYCFSELDLVLIWKRVLTPLEIKSISANPWQVFEPYQTFIPSLPSGSSSVTANLSASEANDSISSSGVIAVNSVLSITELSDAITASGSLAIVADVSVTENIDSISATGTTATEIIANASIIESADSLSSTGALSVSAALALSEEFDTVTAASTVAIASTLAITESGDSLSSSALVGIAANSNVVESADSIISAGTVAIVSNLAKTEGNDSVSSTASLLIVATASINEASDSISSDGSVAALGGINANASITESADSLSSIGALPVSAALALSEAFDTVTAASTVAIASTLAITESGDSLSSAAAIGINAAANITEASDVITSATGVAITASALLNEIADSLNSDGFVLAAGNNAYVDVVESADTLSANATGLITASLAIDEASDGLTSNGILAVNSVLLITESADSASIIGSVVIDGVLAINEGSDSLNSDGFVQEAGSIAANLSIIEADDMLISEGIAVQAAKDNGQIVHVIHYVDKSVQPKRPRTDYHQPVQSAPPLKGKDKPSIQITQPENSVDINAVVNAVSADDSLSSNVSVYTVSEVKGSNVSIEKTGKATVVEITKPLADLTSLGMTIDQEFPIMLNRDDEDALLLILMAAGL